MTMPAGSVGVEVLPDFTRFGSQFKAGIGRAVSGADTSQTFKKVGQDAGEHIARGTEEGTKKSGRRMFGSVGKTMGSGIKVGIMGAMSGMAPLLAGAMGLEAIGGLIKDSIGAASDFGETLSKTKTIFGKSSQQITDWAKNAAKSMGMSQQAAMAGASQFGNFFDQIGVGAKQSVKMSTGLVQLSSDLASFNNADPAQVMEAFQGATRGEYDSLQQFIPTVSAATVQAEALRQTHKKSINDVTDAEKATALYSLAMKGAGAAQGDFSRTSGGLANQQRIMSAQWQDMKVTIGNAFLPAITAVTTWVNQKLFPALKVFGGWLRSVFSGDWAAAGEGVRNFFSKIGAWAQEAIPKLLASLGKWLQAGITWLVQTAIPTYYRWLFKLGAQLVAWIGPRIGPALKALGEWLGRAVAWLRETGLPLLWSRLQELGGKLIAWIGPRIQPMLGELGKFLGRAVGWILGTGVPMLTGALLKLSWKLITWIVPRIPGMLVEMLKLFGALIKWLLVTAMPWLTKTMIKMGASFASGFIDSIRNSKMGQKIGQIFDGVITTIKRTWDKVTDAVRGPINSLINFINTALIDNINKVTTHFGFTISRLNPVAGRQTNAPRAFSGFKDGGPIPGRRGLRRKDNTLAPVQTGEYVMPVDKTRKFLPWLDAMRSGGFANGGLIGTLTRAAGAGLNKLKSAGDWVKDLTGKGASWVVGKMLGPIRAAAGQMFPSGLLNRVISTVLDKVGAWGKAQGSSAGDLAEQLRGNASTNGLSGLMKSLLAQIRSVFPGIGLLSGFRKNSRTLSGNLSRHALGLAMDLSPIKAAGKYIHDRWGRQLLELITPWREYNMYRGRPHRFSPAIERQHGVGSAGNDHIHMGAYDQGGILPTGTSLVYNGTGSPETILTDEQTKALGRGGHTFIINAREAPTERTIMDAMRRVELVYG